MTGNVENKKRSSKKTKSDLESRVDKLEACLAKIAHMSGQERVLLEFGIEKWVPGRNDMRKYKD